MFTKKVTGALLVLAMVLTTGIGAKAVAQADTARAQVAAPVATPAAKKKAWYEVINLRGYAQIRYNRLLETNPDLKCDQCDKSLGENGSLFIRRARLIFSGNVHERVFIYIQPDLASSPSSTSLNFAQLRDAYFDLALDKEKVYRLRVGQSKIPYGFENLQSSSNRLALDRNDALNSAVANERDLGIIFYYTPPAIRARLTELANAELKGAGDYGMFGFGVYNGQTANRPEANNSLHVVARMTYPLKLKNGQYVETGIQAYSGKYVVTPDQLSSKDVQVAPQYIDERMAATVVVYPQPLGFQAEFNIGRGPQFVPAAKATDGPVPTPTGPNARFEPTAPSIQTKSLQGGYAQLMYRLKFGEQLLLPFAKVQYYEGGKKHERDATGHVVYETEIGAEWQPIKNFELVGLYSIGDRTTINLANASNRQHGSRLRLQAQFNF